MATYNTSGNESAAMPGEYCDNPDGCQLGGVHPNDNYRMPAAKSCKNCDQLAPKIAPRCAWCGSEDFQEVSTEQLEEAGISLPGSMEHWHVH